MKNSYFIYGDLQFGKDGDFSLPSKSGFTTRLDNTLATCQLIADEISRRKPKYVIGLGDNFDPQSTIDTITLSACSEGLGIIGKTCDDVGAEHHVIVGNHDIITKDSRIFSSKFLDYYPNTFVHLDVEQVGEMAFVPFLSNEYEMMKKISNLEPGSIVFSHIDIKGSYLNDKYVIDSGIDPSVFSKFSFVFNGHIHIPQKIEPNIWCVGSALQFYAHERPIKIPRGFYFVDSDSLSPVFIKNTASPAIYKTRSIEELKTFDSDSYVIFEYDRNKMSESEAINLVKRFQKYRVLGVNISDFSQTRRSKYIKSTTEKDIVEEFFTQYNNPLVNKEDLKRESLNILNKGLKGI
jgi:hypothetical protein